MFFLELLVSFCIFLPFLILSLSFLSFFDISSLLSSLIFFLIISFPLMYALFLLCLFSSLLRQGNVKFRLEGLLFLQNFVLFKLDNIHVICNVPVQHLMRLMLPE